MKINLACCDDLKEGYLNVDLNPIDSRVMAANALNLPFKENSIEEIFCSHFAEHLTIPELQVALHEWKRVLIPGGDLIIIVPDIQEISKCWVKAQVAEKMGWWNPAIFGSHRGPGQIHMCGLDESILRVLLAFAGYIIIKAGVGAHHFWLQIEARKP